MDLFTREHLSHLLENRHETCVSIYLPTHRAAPETEQDPIRFKNLLRDAKRQLTERECSATTVQSILDPPGRWLRDTEFWRHQSDGLAVFLTESSHRRFRLPRTFGEDVCIGDHFAITPLIPLLQSNGTFYLLTVSQNACRLFVGNRDTLQELDEAQLPQDLQSALGWWRERELNFHSMQRKPQSRGGDDTAVYHGHEEETTEEDLTAYFRQIDAGVTDALRGESAPLVFAGVEYLFPIYARVNNYAHLCNQPIKGNPDQASPSALHREAWQIVRPRFDIHQQDRLEAFGRRAAAGMATNDMTSILHAAASGLVESLIFAEDGKVPGCFNEITGEVDLQPGEEGEDLLDRAVVLTLKSSGEAIAVNSKSMPDETTALAMLRAPLSTVAT